MRAARRVGTARGHATPGCHQFLFIRRRMLRELGPTCFLPATRCPRFAPIPLYAPCMDRDRFNRLMAELEPEDLALIPRAIRVGWIDEAEADQWRRVYDAWQAFLGLDHEPPNPN